MLRRNMGFPDNGSLQETSRKKMNVRTMCSLIRISLLDDM